MQAFFIVKCYKNYKIVKNSYKTVFFLFWNIELKIMVYNRYAISFYGEGKMKKRILSIAAVLLCFVIIFSSCADNTQSETAETTARQEATTVEVTKPVSKYSTEDNLIALTYDDGPGAEATNRILDILEENESTATFFVVGYNISNNIPTIKRAVEMGCEIGNHSQGHKNLTKCTASEIKKQVNNPNETLKELAGVDVKLFRAPGGNFTGVEKKIGMPIIQWNVDTQDWKYKDAANKERTEEEREAQLKSIAENVVNNARKGDIILMHDIYNFTADLSEQIIPALVEKGFKLVTVSEMYLAYGEELEAGKVYYNVEVLPADLKPVELGKYRVKTNGGNLNIREYTNKNSPSIAKIPNGTDLTVTDSIKGWAYVKYSGVEGWVNSSFLEKVQ